MIRHFFLDKGNTILKGSKVNTGLNPVLSINYGLNISRGLIHFDAQKIYDWIRDNSLDINELKFVLHMTNYFALDYLPYEKDIVTAPGAVAERAASFDLEFFSVPMNFDAGRGYDYHSDFWVEDKKSISEHGCNWYNATDATEWEVPGVYSSGCTVIATQHFDFGNENINVDITDYVLDGMFSESESGSVGNIGIKFVDGLENMRLDKQQVVDFFTDNTNLFFHPYIEAIYTNVVHDDRYSFNPNKVNDLYLYVNDGAEPINLDSLPTCSVGVVSQVRTGVYKTRILPGEIDASYRHIEYDVWSDLFVNGVRYDDVEQEFVVLPPKIFNVREIDFKEAPVPAVFGINDSEDVPRHDVRTVFVDFRKKYTTDEKILVQHADYRIYVKDGSREYTIFDFSPLEMSKAENFFVIHTEDLIPNRYFVDVRLKIGMTERYYKDVLHFNVVNELKPKYNE